MFFEILLKDKSGEGFAPTVVKTYKKLENVETWISLHKFTLEDYETYEIVCRDFDSDQDNIPPYMRVVFQTFYNDKYGEWSWSLDDVVENYSLEDSILLKDSEAMIVRDDSQNAKSFTIVLPISTNDMLEGRIKDKYELIEIAKGFLNKHFQDIDGFNVFIDKSFNYRENRETVCNNSTSEEITS